ncbi:MAG: hypothetical protein RM022_010650 [Nostoc sp. EfeVER01]|nr:hypothetical protein [Nostoc sp. EfeVER01]
MSQLLVQELQKFMHFHYLYLQLPTLIVQKKTIIRKVRSAAASRWRGFFIADLPQYLATESVQGFTEKF